MFTFCDVLHDAEQKKHLKKLSRVSSTDWESALRDFDDENIQNHRLNTSKAT